MGQLELGVGHWTVERGSWELAGTFGIIQGQGFIFWDILACKTTSFLFMAVLQESTSEQVFSFLPCNQNIY
jgi:hypothetical protein